MVDQKAGQILATAFSAGKAENRQLARERFLADHIIRILKIFRILSERYRNRRKRFGLRFKSSLARESPAFRPGSKRLCAGRALQSWADRAMPAPLVLYLGPMAHRKHNRLRQDAYWMGAHTKHRLRAHLVRVPKYRRRVLEGPVAARLEALLRQAAEVNRRQIHELAAQPDHVHLLLQVRPTEDVSSVVSLLKGGTSRVSRAESPDLRAFLWGDSFWADSYFADTQ